MTRSSAGFPGFSIACGVDDDPENAALAVTRASASTLWAVGRFLPREKRRLFEAAYATMRIVDDLVDDGFLAAPPAVRDRERQAVRTAVDDWLARCRAALAGTAWRAAPAGAGGASDPLLAAGAGPLYDALTQAARAGGPGDRAWRLLAGAMRRDAAERPIDDWPDFLSYCEGATVAPAAVFLFVLTARAQDGRLASTLDEEALFDAARPMALFCYLVHILRDLAKDAPRGGQLVTLPADLLAAHGLTREAVAAAVAARAPEALGLAADLAGRAAAYRAETEAVRERLAPDLGPRERAILAALTTVYARLHDGLAAAPERALDPQAAAGKGEAAAVFAAEGLTPDLVEPGA
ncbi:MAG: squalene/phytoene synthase family protein [Alphaproteobacteria bacterium]|nr:squalene/phytoene synthase family protein [Alphaproteobacteria bacterium]